ncbi:hypothetical protein F5Y04DRAFT_275579 [Hypomontagnella monticulosa]|nr:hypothetical protein F5Y04DRAFT_275579 [Hypomontagnella monticulosa]
MTPAILPSRLPPEEDESEWEYEYSNTETETFYVTLDLSKADFTSGDASIVNRPGYRGGEKAERAKLYLNRRMSPSRSPDDSDEDGTLRRNPNLRGSQPNEVIDEGEEDQAPSQVQILDLHTEKPIISYKGRVFAGQWSQNVGTELLMAKRDDENPIPALRQLDHDVDLLAASCARITVKEMQLKPKEAALKRQLNSLVSAEDTTAQPLVPPAEKWARPERIMQGNFLANFIALKKRMGQTDDVTVIAKAHDPRPNHNKSRRKHKQGHRGKYNLPRTRGPRRVKPAGLLHVLAGRGQSPAPSSAGSVAGTGYSTPTPQHWDDLEEDGRLEEEEEGEEDEVMILDDANDDGMEEDVDLDGNEFSGSGGEEDSVDDMDVDEV